MINVHAVAMPGFSITGPDVDEPINVSMGPGMGAQIGYAFSPRYSVCAGLDLARLGAAPEDGGGHWGLGMLELGGRMSFPSQRSRVTPYITAAAGTPVLAAKRLRRSASSVSVADPVSEALDYARVRNRTLASYRIAARSRW